MRRPYVLGPVVALLLGACSSSPSKPASTTTAGTTPDSAAVATDPLTTDTVSAGGSSKACAMLSPADFAAVGVTVDHAGEDVSKNFNLSTTTSVACQWTNFDNNVGGSWELVIGTGGAKDAFASDLSLAELGKVTRPSIGDEAYLEDKTSSFDATDHDFELGVRIGDTFFTMSTTDDAGAAAVTALATVVAGRLTP